jgi:hypothetical protein
MPGTATVRSCITGDATDEKARERRGLAASPAMNAANDGIFASRSNSGEPAGSSSPSRNRNVVSFNVLAQELQAAA